MSAYLPDLEQPDGLNHPAAKPFNQPIQIGRRNKLVNANCCGNLFSKFQFHDLRTTKPPDEKGVYAIRVKRSGKATSEIVAQVAQLVEKLSWSTVGDFILSRVRRLQGIGNCPIIYIGSAGTRSESRNTLLKRYREFSGRHTAMYPVWALLYFGWELEFGWIEQQNAGKVEAEIKEKYRQLHGGKSPAIVQK